MYEYFGDTTHGQRLVAFLSNVQIKISILEDAARILQMFGNNEKSSWDKKIQALNIAESFLELIKEEKEKEDANYVDDGRYTSSR